MCAACHVYHPAPSIRIDHRRALFLGGLDEDDNVQSLCVACHKKKSAAERAAARLTT